MIGIYKITFPNGHYYIGQSVNTKRRESQHKRELALGIHSNKRLQNCFDKYGSFLFEVIEECSKEDLSKIEDRYLFDNVDNESCCNICKYANSVYKTNHSDETRKRISAYQHLSGKVKPVYMFSRDEEFLLGRFDSIRDAERAINCNPKDVQKSCKSNGYYNVQKYKFRYAAQVDTFLDHIKEIVPF